MRPVLECASRGEARISEVVEHLADTFGLTADERAARRPGAAQTTFANRVHWAKSFLKQARLVEITGPGRFKIMDRGLAALADTSATINSAYLEQFREFQIFKGQAAADSSEITRPQT